MKNKIYEHVLICYVTHVQVIPLLLMLIKLCNGCHTETSYENTYEEISIPMIDYIKKSKNRVGTQNQILHISIINCVYPIMK